MGRYKKHSINHVLPSAIYIEHPWYTGEETIERQDEPWLWNVDGEADHDKLAMCDGMTMEAVTKSGLIPRREENLVLVAPSYLSVMLPADSAILTAQRAIEVSTAFSYACTLSGAIGGESDHQLPQGDTTIQVFSGAHRRREGNRDPSSETDHGRHGR